MHVSLRNTAALLALIGAASLSWYFSRPAPEAPQPDRAGAGGPLGYYLRDATLLGTDEDGRLLFRIHAAEAVQGRESEDLELTDVRVEYRDERSVGWSISAERAVTPGNHAYVDLSGARLENDGTGEHMIIEAPLIRLDPEAYYAATDGEVDVRVGETTLTGVGLEARLREDFIEVRSEVHGTYKR